MINKVSTKEQLKIFCLERGGEFNSWVPLAGTIDWPKWMSTWLYIEDIVQLHNECAQEVVCSREKKKKIRLYTIENNFSRFVVFNRGVRERLALLSSKTLSLLLSNFLINDLSNCYRENETLQRIYIYLSLSFSRSPVIKQWSKREVVRVNLRPKCAHTDFTPPLSSAL